MAFLLLGFIAMLAIVPPIVRGRIEESPLESTRHFKKSMMQMAASVNPGEYGKGYAPVKKWNNLPVLFSAPRSLPQSSQQPAYGRPNPVRQASARRARVYLVLGFLVVVSGIAAIIAKSAAFTAIFFACAGLLVFYLLLVQFMVKRRERMGF